MIIIIFLLLSFLILSYNDCIGQEAVAPVVITKKVEVVDYEYNYIMVELRSSIDFSVFYPYHTMQGTTPSQLYFEEGRNARPSFDVGVKQTVKLNNWSVTTGISFQRVNELFSYNEYSFQNVTVQDENGNIRLVHLAIGEPIVYTQDNNLNYLVAPLKIAYSPLTLKDKLSIGIQGNFHYLLSSYYWAKFSLPNAAEEISENFNPFFFSITANSSFNIKLSKKISAEIEPYYSVGLSPIIDSNELSFSLNCLGVCTRFNLNY
jgi:hypothetical protein